MASATCSAASSAGGGGGGGFPIPGGLVKGGGGLIGLLIVAAVFILPKLLGGGLGGNGSSLTPAADSGSQGTTGSSETCSTELEQVLCGAVNDVADFWIDGDAGGVQPPVRGGADRVLLAGHRTPAAGRRAPRPGPSTARSTARRTSTSTSSRNSRTRSARPATSPSQYIVAHEYGHHIQNLVGINEQMQQAQQADPSRANQYSVALELQADCFAGVVGRQRP